MNACSKKMVLTVRYKSQQSYLEVLQVWQIVGQVNEVLVVGLLYGQQVDSLQIGQAHQDRQ